MAFAKRERREAPEQDFELNIASIIDCFTVLITYLLISASFISIGVFDVSGTVFGESDAAPPKVTLAVKLMKDNQITVELGGQEKSVTALPAKGGNWDYDGLATQLESIHGRFPELASASVAAVEAVEYHDLVKSIESVRKVIPAVSIGDQVPEGF